MIKGPFQRVIRRGKRRDKLTAKRWNEPVDAVNQLLRGSGGGRQVSPAKAARPTVQRFRVVSVGLDVLVCNTWDGTTSGAEAVDVALPYLLRRTPFDGGTRDGVSYVYTSNTERSATDGINNETQIITPAFVAGDEVWADAAWAILGGTGVDGTEWLARNDTRAWAVTP